MTAHDKQPTPSLYPDATVNDSKPHEPEVPPPPKPAPPSLDSPTYDLLLQIQAAVKPPVTEGMLRVMQFLDSGSYHAFLSIQNLNIPLLPSCPVYKRGSSPHTYELHIPNNQFTLTVSHEVDKDLVISLEQILKWFCQWNDAAAVGNTDEVFPTTAVPDTDDVFPTTTAPDSPEDDRYKRLGDKGVRFVETMGARVNAGIQRRMSNRAEAARGKPQHDVKLGGNVTKTALSGARTVVSVGATVASKVTETVSEVVGKGLARNPLSKNMASAPEGSGRRKFHDNLMGGLVAFGRVYVAADEQGKLIIQTAAEGSAEWAGAKYGEQAHCATKNLGGIAFDGYRIARFPGKMGTVSLLKGGLKSCARKGETVRGSKQVKTRGRSKSDASSSGGPQHTMRGQNPDTLI